MEMPRASLSPCPSFAPHQTWSDFPLLQPFTAASCPFPCSSEETVSLLYNLPLCSSRQQLDASLIFSTLKDSPYQISVAPVPTLLLQIFLSGQNLSYKWAQLNYSVKWAQYPRWRQKSTKWTQQPPPFIFLRPPC